MIVKTKMQCAACRKEFKDAMEVWELQEGILGLRGVVPLENPLHFCSTDCLKDYLGVSGEKESLKRRVP